MERQKELQREKTQELYKQNEVNESYASNHNEHVCPHCGAINEPDALFCEECGGMLGTTLVCPNCRLPVPKEADFCEHCQTYIATNRCSFCGASMAPTDSFCPECGNSRQGIICPACKTHSPFSYCPACGMPLTEKVVKQRTEIQNEPAFKQMDQISAELDKLKKTRPIESPKATERAKQTEELAKRVQKLLGKEYQPTASQKTVEELQKQIKEKEEELQALLDKLTTATPQENPILTRNYIMARKPASTILGWKCNYKQAIHSSPCGCACPHLGGRWIVLDDTTQIEDDTPLTRNKKL